MMQAAQIVGCAGFSVIGPSGVVGWVEEVWLDEGDAPAGVAVELFDERRVFLPAADIADVSRESVSVTMRPGSRLLALELPRVATADANGEPLTATWKTTDEPVDLTAPGGLSLVRGIPGAKRATSRAGRPLWQVIGALYVFLAVLVSALIGIDFLVAYLVTGAPPY